MAYNDNQIMEVAYQPASTNDYAVAKDLNVCVMEIILIVVMADSVGLIEDLDTTELNRTYVLLINELQKLYDRNPELTAIKPEPIWKRFDVLETLTWDINEYSSEHSIDELNTHNARVKKLCIVAGKETHDYSPEQRQLADNAETVNAKYVKMINEANMQNKIKKDSDWHIPEYKLTYKPDGTILVNEVLKLKKIHAGSITERLLEQALKNPNELFKPDLGQTARNLSTVLNSAGFTKELKDLFFPTVSNDKGVIFRATVTREQVNIDNIDTTKLDLKLKELGATTVPKSSN